MGAAGRERATLGAGAFAGKDGTNAGRRNAFGRCVSKPVSRAGQRSPAGGGAVLART